MDENRTALVTGASSGIGAEFARVLAAQGYDLVLVARRQQRLNELAEELQRLNGISAHVIVADLSQPETPHEIRVQIDQLGIQVDFLVNNAGYAVARSFLRSEWSTQEDFLNVMVVSVTRMCHEFAPQMVKRRWGRIVNVASLAAFAPEAVGSLYTAVKSYEVSFSRALHMEVRHAGVHVTALCPGFTYTEFHDALGNRKQMNRPAIHLVDGCGDRCKAGISGGDEGAARSISMVGSIA